MRHLMNVSVAAAALLGGLVMAPNLSEAQAPNAMVRQYGYQFCAILGGFMDGRRDCMYSTWQQCMAAASPRGTCEENAAYIAARANAGTTTGQSKRRH